MKSHCCGYTRNMQQWLSTHWGRIKMVAVFTWQISRSIFFCGRYCSLGKVSHQFVFKIPINNKSTLMKQKWKDIIWTNRGIMEVMQYSIKYNLQLVQIHLISAVVRKHIPYFCKGWVVGLLCYVQNFKSCGKIDLRDANLELIGIDHVFVCQPYDSNCKTPLQ